MNPKNTSALNMRILPVLLGALLACGAAQTQEMDHEEMGHQGMDHEGMDHEGMDQGGMDHSGHHNMTQEEYDLLREKVITYRNYTNEQIMDNMMQMPPTHERYISDSELAGDLGIIVLTHGAFEPGDTLFANSLTGLARQHPVAIGYGMAMMNGNHIQSAIEQLEAAGAQKIVVVPAALSPNGTVYEQWAYYLGERDEAAYLPAPRVSSNVPLSFAAPLAEHSMASSMLLDHAREISQNPENEFVLIVGHGPSEPAANEIELRVMQKHVESLKAGGGFADVKGYNFQDDSPPEVRAANVATMRGWIEEASAAGLDVIMVGYLLSTRGIQHKIPIDFEGLEFTFNEKGLSAHPDFAKWVETNALETAGQS